jgi:hypothetical protein
MIESMFNQHNNANNEVQPDVPLKMLRYALLANGNFAHWTDLLERTARARAADQKARQ